MRRTALVLVAVCCAAGCGPRQRERAPELRAAVPVEARRAHTKELSATVTGSGVAEGVREAWVQSQTQGTIASVAFTLGRRVAKGALLVQVENSVQEAGFRQAEAAQLVAAQGLRSAQALFEQGNASSGEMNQARAAAAAADAGLAQARKAFADTRIAAPIAGYVADKGPMLEMGNTLNPGAHVARIVDISSLKTTIAVSERDVGALRAGQKAMVSVAAVRVEPFDGAISAIAAGSEPSTGAFAVEVTWRNTKERAIRAGMSVRVEIATDAADTALVVPSVAVVEMNRRDAVWVSNAGAAAVRFVTVGRRMAEEVEILDGLREGDTVLTSGLARLSQGDSLLVALAAEPGSAR